MVRLTFLFAIAIIAGAAPLTCVTANLQTYLNLPADGCSLGGAVVSEFRNPGVLPGSTQLDPTTVSVMPLVDGNLPGLGFTYNRTASGGSVLESVVDFLASFSGPVGGFATLTGTGAFATGAGLTLVTSEFCPGAGLDPTVCSQPSIALAVFTNTIESVTSDRSNLPLNASYRIRHDAILDAGLGGQAMLGAAELRFTQVPEPSTAALCMAALTACVLRRRLAGR